MALVSEEDFFYDFLQESTASNVDEDKRAMYNRKLSAAEGYFLNAIDRPLEQATYTESYSGLGVSFLVLQHYPIISLTSVGTYDTAKIKTGDKGRIFYTEDVFEAGEFNIDVEYKAGYDTIPEDVKTAVGSLAMALYEDTKHGSGRLNIELKEHRDNRTEYENSVIPDATQQVIEKYKDDRLVKVSYVPS